MNMKVINKLIGKIDISSIKFKKEKKDPSLLKELIDEPEKFILTAFIENDEIKISVKKKES